jgi:hypothetical protein
MQTSGAVGRENAKPYLVVIVREGGRSSIPEAAVIETIGRSVLDTRLRGYDVPSSLRAQRLVRRSSTSEGAKQSIAWRPERSIASPRSQ